ncbi:MAG: hypothetical protein QM638_13870 [Nocardioides sp.]|uniref:hypothetical protein n=1 Tax=Nocardioides sp. TaxID=35761 RepID=UPI0039E557BB
MTNLTISVGAETLKRARMRALERGESVNQFLAEQLRRYAESDDVPERQRSTNEALAELAGRIDRGSGGRAWSRAELYDERRVR